jgi:protein-S-isoprenylcysteine O-methyltransferase Ste14
MSRFLVTLIFLAVTGLTALNAFRHVDQLFTDGSAHMWAVAGYGILKTVIVGAFCFFVAVRDEPRRHSRDPVAFIAFAVALAAIVFLRQPSETNNTAIVLFGDLVALASCLWLLASVLALGRCFGVLPEARGLVTRGPYAIVRHPVYVGEFGTCLGFLIAAPSLWNLASIVTFCAAQAVRMRLEERALTREFPEYADYAARTPLVIPRLRRDAWRPLAGSRAS